MRVVVTKKPYRGKPVGAEVELSARDARVLIALGLMQPATDKPVVAEPVVEEEVKPQRRVYRRRDMTAED